jgi:DNA-binding MarR family transcriptional regulator
MKFNATRMLLLSTIAQYKEIGVSDLCELAQLSQGSTIYRYLEHFEKQGLITMEKQVKQGGQAHKLKITKKGSSLKLPSLGEWENLSKLDAQIDK